MSDDYYKSKQVLDDSRDSRMRKLSLCLYGCHLLGWSCPSDLHPADHTASDAGISDIKKDEDYTTYVSSSSSLSCSSDSKFSSDNDMISRGPVVSVS